MNERYLAQLTFQSRISQDLLVVLKQFLGETCSFKSNDDKILLYRHQFIWWPFVRDDYKVVINHVSPITIINIDPGKCNRVERKVKY